ncbi:SAM hydrolase/SAM-dependent halogenase family protein [Aeoliella sp.]|uniref:SAM hydrolase/SAM-dependent halogenase family protein n=1 Tax=Aeoliella sp. TaxID=2795800 RepID=UPI003CCBA7C7
MEPRPIITLTTDFGEGSRYVGAMKGVLLSINPDADVVDISHTVPHQDIRQGALTLLEATPYYPPGTLHIAVIDPGVGTSRRILYAEIDQQRYICPDNGLLTCLADRAKPSTMRSVENSELWLDGVSHTFHGRDIMAPVAARLSLGIDPTDVGPVIEDYARISLPRAERVAQKIEGEVIEVDSFGNLITNITAEMIADVPRDENTRVRCDEHETLGIFDAYGDQPPMTLIALVGSGDKLELAIVDDSAKIMLGVGVGVPVTIEW